MRRMIWQTINNKVRRAFTNAADQYEVLATLHREIGRELIKKVVDQDCSAILDVGTGTGYLARKAKFFFPEAMVVGLDFSDGMIQQARKSEEHIEWILADATGLPFKPHTFDVVVSNLAYQWVKNLNGAFKLSHQVLKDDGIFCSTLFGYNTLNELFATLAACGTQPHSFRRLAARENIEAALRSAGFREIKVDYELIKIEFSDVRNLLKWLKAIGANVLNNEIFIGREFLARVDEYYRKHFPYHQGIAASFEVVWIFAKKG